MDTTVKSGKEILDEFFDSIQNIENVDPQIASVISILYKNNKLTDTNLKNELLRIRNQRDDKNQ